MKRSTYLVKTSMGWIEVNQLLYKNWRGEKMIGDF